ncbi:MAG: hypothetical protein NZO16_04790 [Deltaproteobacteria bacterium]|nr:hypothetical protein [Deltaproteobacteria bacterium]
MLKTANLEDPSVRVIFCRDFGESTAGPIVIRGSIEEHKAEVMYKAIETEFNELKEFQTSKKQSLYVYQR